MAHYLHCPLVILVIFVFLVSVGHLGLAVSRLFELEVPGASPPAVSPSFLAEPASRPGQMSIPQTPSATIDVRRRKYIDDALDMFAMAPSD